MNMPRFDTGQFLTGDKFRLLCDVDCEHDKNWQDTLTNHPDEAVTVFCQTHELKNKMPIIGRCRDKKIIMVSHNSDGSFAPWPGREFDFHWEPVSNVVHWFCQNCEVDDPSVTPIPIALENEYIFRPEIKQAKMVNLTNENRKKEMKVFLCFNIGTNPKHRQSAWDYFIDKPWATCQEGFNNIGLVKPYFNTLADHQFMLCPDGNGIDCIRTWEALYMGVIPIVERHVFSSYFATYLPIWIVNSWEEVTEDKMKH